MEMALPLTIERIRAKVALPSKNLGNLHAFGTLEVYLEGETKPLFLIKGFTIRTKVFQKPEGEVKVLTVVFPAFPAGKKYMTSFFIDNKSLWADVNKLFHEAYAQATGGLNADESDQVNELDTNEIAEALDIQYGGDA